MNASNDKKTQMTDEQKLVSYLRMFLVPTLALKALLLYFGLNYSQYPDEGYGYGLVITALLSLLNVGLFLWKNWSDSEGFSK